MPSEKERKSKRYIDLRSEKTEEEWAELLHGLAEAVAATWFKWIGWFFATAAIAYFASQTGSSLLKGMEIICYVILFIYFQQFFLSFRIEPYESWVRAKKSSVRIILAILPSVILITVLFISTNTLIFHAVEKINLTK